MADDELVEVYPAQDDMQDTARKLLEAADDLELRAEVVETVNGADGVGFRVPAEVATKAGVAAAPVNDGSFDPSAHTADEVNEYLDGADDAERARVLAAESDGKARKGVVEGPHAAQD